MFNKQALKELVTYSSSFTIQTVSNPFTQKELFNAIDKAETEEDVFRFMQKKREDFIDAVNAAVLKTDTELLVSGVHEAYWRTDYGILPEAKKYWDTQFNRRHVYNSSMYVTHFERLQREVLPKNLIDHVDIFVDIRFSLEAFPYISVNVTLPIPAKYFAAAVNKPGTMNKIINNAFAKRPNDNIQLSKFTTFLNHVLKMKREQIINANIIKPLNGYMDYFAYSTESIVSTEFPLHKHPWDSINLHRYIKSADKPVSELFSDPGERFCLETMGYDMKFWLWYHSMMFKPVHFLSKDKNNMYYIPIKFAIKMIEVKS